MQSILLNLLCVIHIFPPKPCQLKVQDFVVLFQPVDCRCVVQTQPDCNVIDKVFQLLIVRFIVYTIQKPNTGFRGFLFGRLRLGRSFRLLFFWEYDMQMHEHLIVFFQTLNRHISCPRNAAYTFITYKSICTV